MQEYNAYLDTMHAWSVRPYKPRKNLSSSRIYGGIHTFSRLAVTSWSTQCVVVYLQKILFQPNNFSR
jgi:hypothetical protein